MTSLLLVALAVPSLHAGVDTLRDAVLARIARDSGATVAVVARDPVSGLLLEINPDLRFHAASTMKVPVLIELARRVDAGALRWTDSIPVKNQFASLADGSPFTLDPHDDGDSTVYAAIGSRWSLRQLATRMIVRSSNLATNLLIERLDAARVTAGIRRLGADSMVVLRGVEDGTPPPRATSPPSSWPSRTAERSRPGPRARSSRCSWRRSSTTGFRPGYPPARGSRTRPVKSPPPGTTPRWSIPPMVGRMH